MITGELKSRIDRIWDTMWSGGISNPLSVIEQLTYLLFIKRLDELHTLQERKAARTGRPIAQPLFTARQDALRWSRFKELAPERMFETVRDRVFPFIKSLRQTGDADEGSTYTDHMKDALFMMPTPRVLANVVDQLDDIDMADRDTKGDLYEYMLGKIATAGQNGQFRTPRHIIKLMVDMTAPTPKDVICDPACGTAGFLVAASEHLVEHHGDHIYKNARARRRFNEGTFHGYDFDTTMLRIGSMNMLLHGVENPDIRYRDSLAQADLAATGDDAERYSLVLTNPPFAGSLDYESTAKDLQQVVKTKKTELLFLALFLRLLQIGGRAAVIVPDGVLFGSSKAHRTLRKILVEEQKLDAIVSMPSGVFKPYAGVSTASCSSPRPTPEAPTTSGSTIWRRTATRWTTSARRSRRTATFLTFSPAGGTARRSASGRGRIRVSSCQRPRSQATITTSPSIATRRWSTKRWSTTHRA